ncbi:MAG TPA: alpha/beta fold hydrolase, partial [Ktedonobacteraceae bacterium]|nr:alpha/beta fold hydrolase [Ktedonobacteraceae bacterium]
VVGELHIGGVGLARGYLGQPALTAEKFIPHPLSEVPGERLYKTGDLGRYRPNGTIEYIGRIDSQVKIRGFRIEPGEIEATLAQSPGLQESAVICAEVNGENRLVAFVVFGEAALYSSSRLRDYLKASLPDYMLPSHFVLLPALPLTANGKVDRHRLAMPEQDQRVQVHSRPRNNLEFQLQRIWEETLDQRPLGITDNFFELGGHSLLAVRLMTQIQRQLGQDIALSELFQHPTIAELAILLRQQRGPERWPVLAAIQPNGTKTPFFCVHPAGGTVFHYYALARRLGTDQPFYGLQTPDLDGNGTTYNNLPEMAAHYIAAIRSVQPHGPYLLGGWSLGGVIAFEMAQQLRKQGCQVALLALIDSSVPLPNRAEHTGEFDASDVALARYLIERGRIVISDEAFSALGPRGQLLYILEQGKAANAIPEDTDLVQFCRFERMQFINVHAVRSYVPEVYPDCITLFRAINAQGSTEEQEHGTAPQDLTRGWDKLTAQDVDVHVVQGTHADMIDEPNVASLADALRQCLNEVKMPSSTP